MSIWLSLMLLLAQVCSFPRHQLHLVVQMCWCCFPAIQPLSSWTCVTPPTMSSLTKGPETSTAHPVGNWTPEECQKTVDLLTHMFDASGHHILS